MLIHMLKPRKMQHIYVAKTNLWLAYANLLASTACPDCVRLSSGCFLLAAYTCWSVQRTEQMPITLHTSSCWPLRLSCNCRSACCCCTASQHSRGATVGAAAVAAAAAVAVPPAAAAVAATPAAHQQRAALLPAATVEAVAAAAIALLPGNQSNAWLQPAAAAIVTAVARAVVPAATATVAAERAPTLKRTCRYCGTSRPTAHQSCGTAAVLCRQLCQPLQLLLAVCSPVYCCHSHTVAQC